jgi:hypothetical protein
MTRFPFEPAMGALLLGFTVILSLMMIHSPGTSDVSWFVKWTDVLYQNGLVAGYSKVISDFHGDYPPISLAILYIVRVFGDAVGLSPLMSLKVAILAFQLVSTGLILLLSGNYWVAASLNASLLLSGVSLGYLDVWTAPPLIAAFWAFQASRKVLGTVLFLIASLIKWQPLIVAPFIAVFVLKISNLRSCRDAIGTRLFWQLVLLVGAIIAVLILLFGLSPAGSLWHAMNDPFWNGRALNVPWVAEFFYKILFPSFFSRQSEVLVLPSLYLLPFKIIFWSAFGMVVARAIKTEKTFKNCMLFSILGLVTYTTWNSGVHENHLFLAVILAFMLMLHEHTREHWAITTILAVMFNFNMFVFYGVTGTQLLSPVVRVDLSGPLAILYAVAWLLLAVHAWAQPRKADKDVENETHLQTAINGIYQQ